MHLPSIDLAQLRNGDDALLESLLHSCATYGFVKLVGHGIPDAKIQELFAWSRDFFSWPNAAKQTALRRKKGPYRGYAAVGQEQIGAISGYIKGVRDPSTVKDIKESFDFGPADDEVYPTPWPEGPSSDEFKAFMQSFFRDCVQVHNDLLAIFERALDLKQGQLSSLCSAGNAEVRLTHYPPIPVSQLKTGTTYRIAEHTDVGTLTLLFQDTVGGLEIEEHALPGKFVPIASSNPSEMIVNVADTLQRWTCGILRSANHRVLYPQDAREEDVLPARYSVGFFGKADHDASMGPIPAVATRLHGAVSVEENRTAQEYYNFMHERTSVY